jgi:hypothetical protein
MPSTEYFRRQSDICLRLSMITSSEEVANRLIAMAQDYHAKADVMEAQSTLAMPTIIAPGTSASDETMSRERPWQGSSIGRARV